MILTEVGFRLVKTNLMGKWSQNQQSLTTTSSSIYHLVRLASTEMTPNICLCVQD